MTQADLKSYRLDDIHEPTDAQLDQLMENVAKNVKESNRRSNIAFFATLKKACDQAKMRKRS